MKGGTTRIQQLINTLVHEKAKLKITNGEGPIKLIGSHWTEEEGSPAEDGSA